MLRKDLEWPPGAMINQVMAEFVFVLRVIEGLSPDIHNRFVSQIVNASVMDGVCTADTIQFVVTYILEI